ncbi:hypothetical protein H072_10238 [Dactylellina haptotyla CBS 200.50]|uniref:Uncharacterized protein n=1 Tax=Dactylellina haptotyla (strain CBS 200.50) TaxID=1284197 RepID=S8BAR3_DACHA|nr:hypothetical protein H072_10238 [Dactylellina haptotyla CBS 200.50]
MLKISDLPPEIHQGILEYLEFRSTGTQRHSSLKGVVTNSVSGINGLTLRVKQCLPLEEVYEEEEEELCFDLIKLGDCPFLNEPAFLRIPDSYKTTADILNRKPKIPEVVEKVEKVDTVKVKLQFSSRDKNCGIHSNSGILEFAAGVTVMDLLKRTFEEALYEHVEIRREAEDLDRHIQEVGAIKFCMDVGFGDGLEADACVYTDIMPFK